MNQAKPRAKHDGFTLAELMVTLCMLTVLSITAGYSFVKWLPAYRLKSAAVDLFSNFQAARMNAIKEGCRYAVIFNSDANTYQAVGAGEDGVFSAASNSGDDTFGRVVSLSEYGAGIEFGHGDASINATASQGNSFPSDGVSYIDNSSEFTPRGMANKMGYVYLANHLGDAYAISTPTMAGVITMKRWTGREWR